MTLPIFQAHEDPGPSFVNLLTKWGGNLSSHVNRFESSNLESMVTKASIPHGTTIVALRYSDGIVMAGDRRATEGNFIAHRRIEKVFSADKYSAVGIAGAAGPAVEMVRLFQTQLEHYEKVEGVTLSLEGKANQLSQMIRSNLSMAMQGLVVVPLFAGWDLQRRIGRIFTYDVTGGRYEEVAYHAIGSGGKDARTTVKLGFRDAMTRDEAVRLAISALYEAADEDSATGGPDLVRGIYPIIATVERTGFARVDESEVAAASQALIASKSSAGGN